VGKHESGSLDFEAIEKARKDKQGPLTRAWIKKAEKVFRRPPPDWRQIKRDFAAGIKGGEHLIRWFDRELELIERDRQVCQLLFEATQFVKFNGQEVQSSALYEAIRLYERQKDIRTAIDDSEQETSPGYEEVLAELRLQLQSMRARVLLAVEIAKTVYKSRCQRRGRPQSALLPLILAAEINYKLTGGKGIPSYRWTHSEGGSLDYVEELLRQLGSPVSRDALAQAIRKLQPRLHPKSRREK